MNSESIQRRLAAILSADVYGYSRLMAQDEASTVQTLVAYREQVAALLRDHGGRLVDFSGDNFLAEFSTVLNAVRCAVEIQNTIADRNESLTTERRMMFRMGRSATSLTQRDVPVFRMGSGNPGG